MSGKTRLRATAGTLSLHNTPATMPACTLTTNLLFFGSRESADL